MPGQGGVRSDPDGQHHHVGVERGRVLQQHVHAAVLLRKALHGVAQGQADAVPPHLAVDEGGHIRVEGVHQLAGPLDDGDIHPQLPQILRQLQADEAAAGQDGGLGVMGIDVVLDTEGVLYGAQGEQLLQPHAGKPGLGGLGAGREDQLVVGLLKFRPGLQILDGDGFFVRMEGGDLMSHPHIHPEAVKEALRRLEGQGLRVLDHPADVVGQAAVGVGDVPRPLKDHDLRLFVQPAQPGRRRGPSRYAADDDYLHVNASFPFFALQMSCVMVPIGQ